MDFTGTKPAMRMSRNGEGLSLSVPAYSGRSEHAGHPGEVRK